MWGRDGECAETRPASCLLGLAACISGISTSLLPRGSPAQKEEAFPAANIQGTIYLVVTELSQAEAPCQRTLFRTADSQGQTRIWKWWVAGARVPDHGQRLRRGAQLPDSLVTSLQSEGSSSA